MRKTTWKEVYITKHDDWNDLISVRQSFSDLDGYTVRFEGAVLVVETNAPWATLRLWFSYAGVSLRDVLVSKLSSAEREALAVTEEAQKDAS